MSRAELRLQAADCTTRHPGVTLSPHARDALESAEALPPADAEIRAAARLLSLRGARLGGLARAAALTPDRRAEIAAAAGRASWSPAARERRKRPGDLLATI